MLAKVMGPGCAREGRQAGGQAGGQRQRESGADQQGVKVRVRGGLIALGVGCEEAACKDVVPHVQVTACLRLWLALCCTALCFAASVCAGAPKGTCRHAWRLHTNAGVYI